MKRRIRSCVGVCGEAGEAGEHRVDQDRQRHRARAAPAIGDHAEQQPAHGPSDERDAERPSAPHADVALRRARPEQFGHGAVLDEDHQEHVHQVEHPSEIGDQQHEDLPPADGGRRRGDGHVRGLRGCHQTARAASWAAWGSWARSGFHINAVIRPRTPNASATPLMVTTIAAEAPETSTGLRLDLVELREEARVAHAAREAPRGGQDRQSACDVMPRAPRAVQQQPADQDVVHPERQHARIEHLVIAPKDFHEQARESHPR